MKRVWVLVIGVCLAGAWASPSIEGQAAPLLMGSVVPANSLWDKVLKEFGASCAKLAQGRVQIRLVPGQGDEENILRKMQVAGQLQAAALTAIGLARVDPAFNVFGIPLFFESYAELYHVQDRLVSTLKGRLEAKGLVFVHWGNAGWVQVFSRKPVRTIADLKDLSIFTSAGDDRMVQWYKNHGFRPVPLAVTDITASLQRGMIDALPVTPLSALFFSWYNSTPYMLDLGLAPLVGATVITQKAWGGIADADRRAMFQAAEKAEQQLRAEVPKQDQGAVAEMQKRKNLTVTKADLGAGSEWRAAAEKFATSMRGDLVPADIFDLALKERDAYRQQKGGNAPSTTLGTGARWPQ